MNPNNAAASDRSDLGPYIKLRRNALRLTQAALATASGVSEATIRRLESGKPGVAAGMQKSTRSAIEVALHWPGGAMEALEAGAITPDELDADDAEPEYTVSGLRAESRASAPEIVASPPAPAVRRSDLAEAAALVARLDGRDRTGAEDAVLVAAKAWLAELLAADDDLSEYEQAPRHVSGEDVPTGRLRPERAAVDRA